jgi:hypothetical protein
MMTGVEVLLLIKDEGGGGGDLKRRSSGGCPRSVFDERRGRMGEGKGNQAFKRQYIGLMEKGRQGGGVKN